MIYFEDMQEGQVYELGSRTLTQEDTVGFALQYDPQPFHIDPEAAKDSMFGGLAASGWQTASTYMRLLVDGLLNNTASLGSPGVDELRWIKPVYPGDTLTGRFTILELISSKSRPNMGIVRGKGELFNQKGEQVMSLRSVGFFGRRPENSGS